MEVESRFVSPVKNNHLSYQHGHSFIKKNFHKPTNCHYCSELLWGLMGQGYTCEGKIHSVNRFQECFMREECRELQVT